MKYLFLIISILYSTVAFNQTYCIMVDQDDGFKEYLGIFDISTGNLEKVSTSNVSSFVNNGTSPIIDPVNGKYVYLTSNPLSVEIIDLDSGEIETSFNYSNSDTFPRHFAYNILDSSIYCLKVDKNNGFNEYLSTFDISTGSLNQISISSVSSSVNNGTTPIIDPENGKYIYLPSNPGPVKVIDLNSGEVTSSFNYDTGFFPRHFAYTRNNNATFTTHNVRKNIEVYPNPASDKLIIKSKHLINEIKVYALDGKLLKSLDQNVNSIDVSNLSHGLYFLQISINGEIIDKKFIKN